MLSKLRQAWWLANEAYKSILLARKREEGDLKDSYLMKAELQAEKLKSLIEEIAKEITK
jgi:hypothetical protein